MPFACSDEPSESVEGTTENRARATDPLGEACVEVTRQERAYGALLEAFEYGPAASIREADDRPVLCNAAWKRGEDRHHAVRETRLPSGAVLKIACPPTRIGAGMAHDRERVVRLAAFDHDIRNSLSGIIGMAEILVETDLDDRQRRYAETLLGSGQALLATVDALIAPDEDAAREPIAPPGTAPTPPTPEEATEERPATGTAHPLQEDLDILVAEDNEINQCLIEELLRDSGYSYRIVASGCAAVEVWRACRPRLVLMDIAMPGMGGAEATAAIRAEEDGQNRTPVVAVTAHAMRDDRDRFLDAGMDDHLAKPVTMAAFRTVLERYLRGNDTVKA